MHTLRLGVVSVYRFVERRCRGDRGPPSGSAWFRQAERMASATKLPEMLGPHDVTRRHG